MARGVDVARFNHAVDVLADDAARLEARLRLLESRQLLQDAEPRNA
jgi:ubiquinone biosynthesis protein UbiJ